MANGLVISILAWNLHADGAFAIQNERLVTLTRAQSSPCDTQRV